MKRATAITFTVPGRPVPWQRARTHNGRHFTAPEVAAAKLAIALSAKAAGASDRYVHPWRVRIAAIYEPPASWSKNARAAALCNLTKPIGRPDLDNLGKLVLDALNGVAWVDDAHVVELTVAKLYGPAAKTVVTLEAA